MKYILCYGSLKTGFHNSYRLGPNSVLVAMSNVQGVMYLHHNYPKLYKPDTRDESSTNPFRKELVRTHRCEVWQVPDDIYASIHDMEMGAGYVVEITKVPEIRKEAVTFWMPWEHFNPNDKWVEAYTYDVLPEDVREYLKRNMTQKPTA